MSYSTFLKDLIKSYNSYPSSIESASLIVTNDELGKLWYFKSASNGSFWAIRENEATFWLVPKSEFGITEFNRLTVKRFFECRNYKDDSSKFVLIRPARLELIPETDNLAYQEKGILEFDLTLSKRSTDLEYWVSETEDVLFHSLLQKVSTEFNNSIKEDLEAVKLSLAQLESRQNTQNEEDFLLDLDWLEPIENPKHSEDESLALLKNELQQNLENSIANLQDKLSREINQSKNSYNVLIEDLRRSQSHLEKRIREQTQTVLNQFNQNSVDIKKFQNYQLDVQNILTESKNTLESNLKKQIDAKNNELMQKINEFEKGFSLTLKMLFEDIDKLHKNFESGSKTNNQLGGLPPLPPKRPPLPPKSTHTSSSQSSEI